MIRTLAMYCSRPLSRVPVSRRRDPSPEVCKRSGRTVFGAKHAGTGQGAYENALDSPAAASCSCQDGTPTGSPRRAPGVAGGCTTRVLPSPLCVPLSFISLPSPSQVHTLAYVCLCMHTPPWERAGMPRRAPWNSHGYRRRRPQARTCSPRRFASTVCEIGLGDMTGACVPACQMQATSHGFGVTPGLRRLAT